MIIFIPTCWRPFIQIKKNPPNCYPSRLPNRFWRPPNRAPNINCIIFPYFLETGLQKKKASSRANTIHFSEELADQDIFLSSGLNFDQGLNILDQYYNFLTLTLPIPLQEYHFQADLIWADSSLSVKWTSFYVLYGVDAGAANAILYGPQI